MRLITTTGELAGFCSSLSSADFVTVDTEFMRERTFWPQLCLVQLGGPDDAAAIDALAEGIDLAPLFELMQNERVLKVFHAARQDLEIFLHLTGTLPKPIFDSQVAGMVCGYGEAAAYDTLVSRIARKSVDKSSRFTDWTRRPLSERQLHYAISDVTHLRVIYEKLQRQLDRTGRNDWIAEEMATLRDPATYVVQPDEAWRRLKPRNPSPRLVAVLREVAAWREREAQRVDVPRGRILRDEQALEIASHAPRTTEDLAHVRGIGRGFVEGRQGREVIEAVGRGLAVPDEALPPREKTDALRAPGAAVDMLRTLLRLRCDEAGVAPRVVAGSSDIESIAAGRRDSPALHGWRAEIFGEPALRMLDGKLALSLKGERILLIDVP